MISQDASDVAVRFLGVEAEKAEISPLGVDTDIFNPATSPGEQERRASMRDELGMDPEDVVCIYTGRLSSGKDPILLARAVRILPETDKRFKAVFVGSGEQADEIRALGGTVINFVPHRALADHYRACDIGVWPKQESTSMLDASACGLPIIVSDRITTMERVEGVGLTYREGDEASLVEALRSMADGSLRRRLGTAGAQRVSQTTSWAALANKRASDYEEAIKTAL